MKLAEWLRNSASFADGDWDRQAGDKLRQAADELERLQGEVERLENEPRCTCGDLALQIMRHSKALESSCAVHEWDLIDLLFPKHAIWIAEGLTDAADKMERLKGEGSLCFGSQGMSETIVPEGVFDKPQGESSDVE